MVRLFRLSEVHPVVSGSRCTVGRRLSMWPVEKEQLWQAAVERSQRRASDFAKPRDAKKKVEKSVVEALRLGDVKKAFQVPEEVASLVAPAPVAPCDTPRCS